MLLIKFPRVKPRLLHLYVFTYKIDLFSYCRIFTNSFPFSNRQISQSSTLGASQHSSIPHREIPLRFRERGRARSTCRHFTSSFPFASNRISPCSSLGASQHSSILHCKIPLRFRERGLPVPSSRAKSTHFNIDVAP